MEVRKRLIGIMIVLLVTAGVTPVFAEYDAEVVRQVMRDNVQQLGTINSGLSGNDYMAVARGFAEIAQGSNQLLDYTPPKGSKAEWDEINRGIVDASMDGVIAASNGDADAARAALNEVIQGRNAGHQMFR